MTKKIKEKKGKKKGGGGGKEKPGHKSVSSWMADVFSVYIACSWHYQRYYKLSPTQRIVGTAWVQLDLESQC